MFQKIRKLLCIHSFEYEIGHNIVVKECRVVLIINFLEAIAKYHCIMIIR